MARLMTIQDKKQFNELEMRERWMLRKLSIHLNALGNGKTYEFHGTGLDSDAPYDALLLIKDMKMNTIGRFVVELKNRTSAWEDFIYEQVKHRKLVKVAKQDNLDILYVNFTPDGTYIFYISDLKLPKAEKMAMAHESFATNWRQRDKNVYLLNKSEAYHIPLFFNEQEYLDMRKQAEQPISKPVNKQEKKVYSLF